MCGITGFWEFVARSESARIETVQRMSDTLALRGPDDFGFWAHHEVGLSLGHRRLAINDLSISGHQPMHSASGRWIIAFNGEIYNHQLLRIELTTLGVAPVWKGHSDTETLLACFDHWGVLGTLDRCVGMFAVAIWDELNRTLSLARDRFGEKPLYYGWIGSGDGSAFVFGSELKAFRAHHSFDVTVCREALSQYFRLAYVPSPLSIYQNIYKLEPGCILTINGHPPLSAPLRPLAPGDFFDSVSISRWWSLSSAVDAGRINPITDETEALKLLEEKLRQAVCSQSFADVPLGAFLSGGVDSSLIVAIMQQHSSKSVKTFTIGFNEEGYDESSNALSVARHLGTDHHEMRVSSRMAQDLIPNLPWTYDEPFADSSQIPTHLVCRSARKHVTVALSGDAGDESFGGYNRYFWGPRIWNQLKVLPAPARKILGHTMASIPNSSWNYFGTHLLGHREGVIRFGEKVQKLSNILLNSDNLDELYATVVSVWADPSSLVIGENSNSLIDSVSSLDTSRYWPNLHPSLSMMYKDSMTYLPDDILCKVDRAAMACSLETRIPFLDHRVVELAWKLPIDMKVRGNTGKWALRQILYKHVPKELIERPKAGFAIPIGQWLRGPLREWADNLISEKRLKSEGYLRYAPIRFAWKEHLSGKKDNSTKLWTVLMFQAWLEKNR